MRDHPYASLPAPFWRPLTAGSVPALAAPIKNIVLLHGAWVDGSRWKPVYEILVRGGYHVSVVQEPLTSLQDDVAATKRILDLQPSRSRPKEVAALIEEAAQRAQDR